MTAAKPPPARRPFDSSVRGVDLRFKTFYLTSRHNSTNNKYNIAIMAGPKKVLMLGSGFVTRPTLVSYWGTQSFHFQMSQHPLETCLIVLLNVDVPITNALIRTFSVMLEFKFPSHAEPLKVRRSSLPVSRTLPPSLSMSQTTRHLMLKLQRTTWSSV